MKLLNRNTFALNARILDLNVKPLIDAPTGFLQHANKNDFAHNGRCLLDDYLKKMPMESSAKLAPL